MELPTHGELTIGRADDNRVCDSTFRCRGITRGRRVGYAGRVGRNQAFHAKKLALLLAAWLLWVDDARAQVSELAQAGVEYFPSSKLEGNPQEVRILIGRFGVTAPIPVSKRVVLLPGATYEFLDFGSSGFEAPNLAVLHDVALNLGSAIAFTDRALAVVSVGGGFASEGLSTEQFIVTASVLGTYRFSDAFTLGAGVGYDRQTGSVSPLPLISLNIRFGERWRIRGVVPTLLELEYHPRSWFTAGIAGALKGNRYHLDPEKYGGNDPELAYSVYSVGPKLTFSFTPYVHASLYGGLAVLRRFELFEDGKAFGSDSLEPGPILGFRLWLGPAGWGTGPLPRVSRQERNGTVER